MAGEGDGERLELCAALPPDERTPETRALVAAARLCQEIEALLPLTPDGAAARADAAAARSAALQAMAKVRSAPLMPSNCCCLSAALFSAAAGMPRHPPNPSRLPCTAFRLPHCACRWR